ncbi:MAG: hypothetical protein IPM64_12480 [Phycisphaerales bacterium]|nr:hypothetical protein [Phycisphaerales bacterium]
MEQACASPAPMPPGDCATCNLLKRQRRPSRSGFEFITEHPLIRSLSDYGRLVRSAFEELHA